MADTGYIATAIPAKVVRTGPTTLFHLAAREFSDAMQWARIAELNGVVDPWTDGVSEILLPPAPSSSKTGILGA